MATKLKSIVISILLIATSSIGAPAHADDEVLQPGPSDLTWAEYYALDLDNEATYSEISRNRGLTPTCALNTGNIYFRDSGSNLKYGAIGIKPTTTCTVSMPSIVHTVEFFKKVWFGLQLIGVWSNSSSFASSLTTKTVQINCSDTRETTFLAVVTSTGTFPNGSSNSKQAYNDAVLNCGTIP